MGRIQSAGKRSAKLETITSAVARMVHTAIQSVALLAVGSPCHLSTRVLLTLIATFNE